MKRILLDLWTFFQGGLSEDLKSWIKEDVKRRSMLSSSHGDFNTNKIGNSDKHIE
jgi:hypothetical protein